MDYEPKKRVNKKYVGKEKFKMNGGKTTKHVRIMEAHIEAREQKLKTSSHDKPIETTVVNRFTAGIRYKSLLNK